MNPIRPLALAATTLVLQAALVGVPASACNALATGGSGGSGGQGDARARYEHAYTIHREEGRRAEAL